MTTAPMETDELMVVGKVVGVQGLKGELRILPLSDFPERFTKPGERWLQRRKDPARPIELLSGRQLPGKELFVVRFAGIDSREAAEALVGEELVVKASDRPKLAKGEFHLLDLVGTVWKMTLAPRMRTPTIGEATTPPSGSANFPPRAWVSLIT